jgi:hypothetical protein
MFIGSKANFITFARAITNSKFGSADNQGYEALSMRNGRRQADAVCLIGRSFRRVKEQQRQGFLFKNN